MITQEQVRKLFSYNSDTGVLTRKTAPSNHVKIGDVAGSIRNGYLVTAIKNKAYLNHRIIFLHYYGYLPKIIDHVNGVPNDNRIENLRACTHSQNSHNSGKRKNNRVGFKNVSIHRPKGKYLVQLVIDGKKRHIGLYSDINEANEAAIAARIRHHGEFYCGSNRNKQCK